MSGLDYLWGYTEMVDVQLAYGVSGSVLVMAR